MFITSLAATLQQPSGRAARASGATVILELPDEPSIVECVARLKRKGLLNGS